MPSYNDIGSFSSWAKEEKDQFTVAVIKGLIMDTVRKANSGHTGGPLSSLDFTYILFKEFLKFDPDNPDLNESAKTQYLKHDAVLGYYELDDQNRIKQPWNMRSQTANTRSAKLFINILFCYHNHFQMTVS